MSDNILRLEVDDRGIGMKLEKKPGGSLGLIGMKERARLVNGSVAVASREGQGTRVLVEIPLDIAPQE
jgi:signal transduction histidine kinase